MDQNKRERVAASVKAKAAAPRRGRGRPQLQESPRFSRAGILRTALKMTALMPLQELSIGILAKSMNVTTALIHYYVGGREWLTSGVMNLFYKDLLRSWPAPTGNWRDDILGSAHALFNHFVRYGGIAAYAVSHSRFRVFQLSEFDSRDYGVEVLDKFVGGFRRSGLSDDRAGIYSNLMIEFIIGTAHATSRHIYPREHQDFLKGKIESLNGERYPNIVATANAPLTIDGDLALTHGLHLFMLGIMTELAGHQVDDAIEDHYQKARKRVVAGTKLQQRKRAP